MMKVSLMNLYSAQPEINAYSGRKNQNLEKLTKLMLWRHDIQFNDTLINNTQHNDIQH